jgi:hypothetical protein
VCTKKSNKETIESEFENMNRRTDAYIQNNGEYF